MSHDCHVLSINIRAASGGFSPGAGFKQRGLNVQLRPLTDALTSPEGNTLTTLPAWPSD